MKNVKIERIILLLLPILCLIGKKIGMPEDTFVLIIFLIAIYLFIRGGIFNCMIYAQIKMKYNYYPKYWVRAPGKKSTFYKTKEYLKSVDDKILLEKMDCAAYLDNTIIFYFIEMVIVMFLSVIL